jgi:hypothetical protein
MTQLRFHKITLGSIPVVALMFIGIGPAFGQKAETCKTPNG